MSSSAPMSPGLLVKRKRTWLSRLWVRIALVLLVIVCISTGIWWWPRRGVVAVVWAGGSVYCPADRPRAIALMNWAYPSGWTSPAFNRLTYFLGSGHTDAEITSVHLQNTNVDDRWLARLTRFPNLEGVDLDDSQLGPGLQVLRDHPRLKGLTLNGLSDRHWEELRRCPQVDWLMVVQPQAVDVGVEHLKFLPQLKEFHLQESLVTTDFLTHLPELPQIESINFFKCPMTDDDLLHLQKLPNLKILDLCKSGPFSDQGLVHLSRLSKLETLCIRISSGQITDAGLQALKPLENLKELIVIRGDFSPTQIQLLQQTLPKARILIR